MKTLILSIFALSAVSASATTIARPREQTATLTRFQIDPQSNLPRNPLEESNITLDLRNSTATLFLDTCPANARCKVAGMYYTLPIVSIEYDGCGTRLIVAKKDDRRRDGGLMQLNIADMSANVCMGVVHGGAVVSVVVKTVAPRSSVETRSVLKGNAFVDVSR